MNRMTILAVSALWLSQLGCGQGQDQACLDYASASVMVSVHDEFDKPLPDARVAYTIDGVEGGLCDPIDYGSFSCGLEEDGWFDIHVTHEGYQPQDVRVRVREIDCHVHRENVNVRMVPEE